MLLYFLHHRTPQQGLRCRPTAAEVSERRRRSLSALQLRAVPRARDPAKSLLRLYRIAKRNGRTRLRELGEPQYDRVAERATERSKEISSIYLRIRNRTTRTTNREYGAAIKIYSLPYSLHIINAPVLICQGKDIVRSIRSVLNFSG